MNNIDLKLNNHYSVAKFIFDEILVWASSKDSATEEKIIADLEKILDKVDEKGYDRAKGGCCRTEYNDEDYSTHHV